MSKGTGSAPTLGSLDDELPPPYTPSAASTAESIFTPQLRAIHSHVQQQGHLQSDIHHILASLVDPVEAFLSSVSQLRPAPNVAEAAFVPAEALSSEWTLTDQGEKGTGEVRKVVRVPSGSGRGKGVSEKGQSSTSGTGGRLSNTRDGEHRGFDDWGRYDDETSSDADPETVLWWSDEDLARRLARQLNPSQQQQQQSSSGGGASMTARAEEVTFRRENEMGIWESKTGWGVVVRVLLRR